jgi:cell division protease FtsH
MSPDSPKVTYKDVAGADEAVGAHEIKEVPREPEEVQALGARIPKGVLLYRPPGTGKRSSRARRPAGGRAVLLKSRLRLRRGCSSASALRVRDLFEQAKQASPCIIFIDGSMRRPPPRRRLGGGHDERDRR